MFDATNQPFQFNIHLNVMFIPALVLCCTMYNLKGPDYDSSSETEMALEEARLNALVQHWESASITASMCSSTSRSLQGTPVRQPHPR